MKERPILFSAPMVRALLAGAKTQTRRVCKLDVRAGMPHPEWESLLKHCPYGALGDRIWVREAWRGEMRFDDAPPRDIPAGAGIWCEASRQCWEGGPYDGEPGKLRPGMFMPRWASRITLEVTGVRVERLQDISYEDAIAEGVNDPATVPPFPESLGGTETVEQYARRSRYPQRSYAALWDEINGVNGDGSWHANPWVWVVEFRRLPC